MSSDISNKFRQTMARLPGHILTNALHLFPFSAQNLRVGLGLYRSVVVLSISAVLGTVWVVIEEPECFMILELSAQEWVSRGAYGNLAYLGISPPKSSTEPTALEASVHSKGGLEEINQSIVSRMV